MIYEYLWDKHVCRLSPPHISTHLALGSKEAPLAARKWYGKVLYLSMWVPLTDWLVYTIFLRHLIWLYIKMRKILKKNGMKETVREPHKNILVVILKAITWIWLSCTGPVSRQIIYGMNTSLSMQFLLFRARVFSVKFIPFFYPYQPLIHTNDNSL